MSERFDQLVAHHSNLRARCAVQRQHLGETADQIEGQLSRVDRGISIARSIVRRPVMIVAGVALIALLGPKRLLRWAGRGAILYSTTRRLLRVVR
jgi:hypothetical protein